ncbi:MAG: SLBB domain-containing protein [Treponema sp.]|jgi:protein involved in polysaccharide export with SLBB domain|nr:SLBB domain-containing protein [Treponema sp.]
MKRPACGLLCLCAALLCRSGGLYAQTSAQMQQLQQRQQQSGAGGTGLLPEAAMTDPLLPNPQLARSSPEYRVTPGDVYSLTYAAGSTPVVYQIVVDTSYRIRVSNLGVINAAGKTFQQVKREAEAVVANNYPLSGVQLLMVAPAAFKVSINGEVQEAQERIVWALARLSAIVDKETLTNYASIRNITITSANKQTKTYDLFKARRFGDMQEDPYVRPEDVITVNRVERTVQITGAVERPETYQLLPEDNLAALISYYAGGYTPLADPSRIEVIRYVDGGRDSGNKIFLSAADVQNDYSLHNQDQIYIPAIIDLMPVMFVEGAITNYDASQGAVTAPFQQEAAAELAAATRITVRFNAGENYASLIQRNQRWFSAISDTQNAYVIRQGERILINLNPMLYDSSYRSDYYLEENDTLVIPFRQYFITVAGAVIRAGRYPYIPDRNWEYYIALAGGFEPTKNTKQDVAIVDITGRKLSKNDAITPETVITATTNHGLYYFNQFAPIVTTILTVVSTTLSILAVTGVLAR